MIIPFTLWILATLDAAFAGFRAAAGRNALLDKRAYYRRSLLIGALYGQLMAGVVAAVVLGIAHVDQGFWPEAMAAATRFLWVMAPYAAIVVLALAIRLIPSIDLKCISSVVVFGPCVLIRPVVVIAAAIYALLPFGSTANLCGLGVVTVLVILTSEAVLRRLMPAIGVLPLS